MRKLWSILAVLVLLGATDSLAQESVRRVSYLPHWLPQSQFAGYYVAYEKGFYRNHGIDVDIMRGGPDRSAMEYLRRGRTDFATSFLSCAIRERVCGLRLINIGQIVQRSTQMLIAKKSSGINSPQDINGRRVSLWGTDFQFLPRAFFRKYNLTVTEIEQAPTMNLFLRGAVDVASAMWYNEYHTVLNSGINEDELTAFFFSDYGTDVPEDGIYALEDTCRKDPGKCCRFVRASVEGWRYAFERPDEALDIVMKYVDEANVPTNRCHQKWMLERMKDVILLSDRDVPIGVLRQEDYENAVRVIESVGGMNDAPAFSDFFKNCVQR
jgi:NitT/TauT family transport system substrate-binding protein